jgi:tRNA(Arg) A34 adenosine deaminase TadA
MCLTACYWARIPRLVFGATSYDVATYGFEDFQLYRELGYAADKRFLQEDAADGPLHQDAADVLRAWADRLPFDVEAKY